jgi:hypothetical protein
MSRNGKWLLIPSAGLTPGGRNQVIAYQTFNLDTATLYTLPSLGPFDQNTGITAGAIANNGTVYFHKAAADNMIYRCIFNGTSYANPVTFHAGYGRILLHEDDVKVFMTTAFYDGTSFKSVNFADLNVHYASSSDLSVILTGGSSASPKILRYNPATGNYASSWTTPVGNLTNRNIHTVACSADGKVMVCCCGWDQQDTSPRGFLISQDTGVTWSFIEHSKPVIDVAISPDGTRILALDTLNRIVEGVFA